MKYTSCTTIRHTRSGSTATRCVCGTQTLPPSSRRPGRGPAWAGYLATRKAHTHRGAVEHDRGRRESGEAVGGQEGLHAQHTRENRRRKSTVSPKNKRQHGHQDAYMAHGTLQTQTPSECRRGEACRDEAGQNHDIISISRHIHRTPATTHVVARANHGNSLGGTRRCSLAPYVITARGRDSFGPAGGTGWGGIEVQPSIPNSQGRRRTQTLYCWHILHTRISSSDPARPPGALGRPQTKHPGSERGQPRLATTAAKRFQPREVLTYMPTRR